MAEVVTQLQLFLDYAPMFNFEFDSTELLAEALKRGFVKKVGDDQYEINENY